MKRKIILLTDGCAARLVKENLSNVQNRIFAASISRNKKNVKMNFGHQLIEKVLADLQR